MKTKDKDRTPVAQILETQCTKCKLPLTHTVVLHNSEGIVERVQCRTCGSEHKYHPEKKKAVKKPAKKRTRASAKTRKLDPAAIFEKLAEKFEGKKPLPYTMEGSYQTDDVIDHKTFGKGIVTGVAYQKMEVAFADTSRLMVCDR
ncbi:MAG: hypothetical protein K9N10_17370 [Deltaproteobacteria bacterium]|nr:hypothetical protein [Deltaproteobacteria bacterium]